MRECACNYRRRHPRPFPIFDWYNHRRRINARDTVTFRQRRELYKIRDEEYKLRKSLWAKYWNERRNERRNEGYPLSIPARKQEKILRTSPPPALSTRWAHFTAGRSSADHHYLSFALA